MLNRKKLFASSVFCGCLLLAACLSLWLQWNRAGIKAQQPSGIDSAQGSWEKVAGAVLPDIAAIGFDDAGQIGAAASSEGDLILSRDGGASWNKLGRAPLIPGEIVGALSISADGSVCLGTGVDGSAYTALHTLTNGKWQTSTGDYGGIAGGNGRFFVGGNMLVLRANGSEWKIRRLPVYGAGMLYATTQVGDHVIVVGDHGLIIESQDGGDSWFGERLSEKESEEFKDGVPFYGVAMAGGTTLVGGANGYLWQRINENWVRIKGLEAERSIFGMYLANSMVGFIAGGSNSGGEPFIYSTINGGTSWRKELLPQLKGRIIGLARGGNGLFAATIDGQVLVRRTEEERKLERAAAMLGNLL